MWSTEDKLENLLRLYEHLENKGLPKSFKREILVEILGLGPKIGVFSEKHFRALIEITDKDHRMFAQHDKSLAAQK